jgi:hypothetical protein
LSQLPPCQSSLQKHIKREYYQAQIWRQATENKEIPNPDQNGWKTTAHGNFLIDWCTEDILPLELVDILLENEPENQKSVDEEDTEEHFLTI